MAILGNNSRDYVGSSSGKFWLATKFTSPKSGEISSIISYIKLGNYDRQIAVGIYNDNSGAPGTCLGYSNDTNVTPNYDDWLEISLISAVQVNSGSVYWLVVQPSSGGFTWWLDSGDANQRGYDLSFTFSDWSNNPSLSYDNYKYQIYANIEPVSEDATVLLSESSDLKINYRKDETVTLSEETDVKTTPCITSLTPSTSIYSRLPDISVEAFSVYTPTLNLYIYTDLDELVWSKIGLSMINVGGHEYTYDYTLLENIDDYLAIGDFKITGIITDTKSNSETVTETFTVVSTTAEIDITNINRNFDGSNRAIVTFKVKSLNEDRVDLRFFMKKLLKMWNYKEKVTLLSVSDGKIHDDFRVIGIKTTNDWKTITTVWRYNDTNTLFDNLKKQTIEIDSKIYVYRDGVSTDISKWVESYNFSRSKDLGSAELNVTVNDTNDISPYQSNSEINQLDGSMNILLIYGNKIVVKQRMKENGVINEYTRFVGKISSVTSTPDKKINIVAYDKFRDFNEKMIALKEYNPDKVLVSENLRSFDGLKFKGTYDSWSNCPSPIINVGGKTLNPGEYVIDYPRGIVYIYRNTFLSGDWVEKLIDDEDTGVIGRQTFPLGFELDDSSALLVEHRYQEKVDYACVDGVEETEVWIEKSERYTENSDYYVDYDENKIYLDSAFPVDTSTVRNHKLYVAGREIETVSVEYYYMESGTNEVEDIIKDLAEEIGFESSDLSGSVTGEELESSNGADYWIANNNLNALPIVYKNGSSITIQDTNDRRKDGIVRLKSGVLWYDKLLDPIVSTRHIDIESGEDVTVSVDTSDYYYGEASLKADFQDSGGAYFKKNYNYEYYRHDISDYDRIAIYLKSNVDTTVTITLEDNASHTQSYNFNLIANTWTKCEMTNTQAWNDEISYIKYSVTEVCILNIDYLHIPRDVITIDYSYDYLRSTGITINDFLVRYEDYDNLMDVMEDLMTNVAPNYLVYVDDEGKLKGQYKRIRWSSLFSEIYNSKGLSEVEAWGKFLLEDYYLKQTINYNTEISDEHIYTSAIIIGKLAERNNAGLLAIATNKSVYASPFPYSKGGTKYKNSGFDRLGGITDLNQPLYYVRKDLESDPSAGGDDISNVTLDNDVYTGAWWYKQTADANDRPTQHEIIEVTLDTEYYWEEIVICIGAYQNKQIRQEIYIEVEDIYGEKWYPESETANKQSGSTGSWVKFKNSFHRDKKIKKVHIYINESFIWITSSSVSNSKKSFIPLPIIALFYPELIKWILLLVIIGIGIYLIKRGFLWLKSQFNKEKICI